MDALREILYQLCDAMIVSGYEKTTNSAFKKLLQEKGIISNVDSIGNIFFKLEGNGDLTLMIVAHYDEVGFSVKYIDDSGYIFLSPIGGIDLSILHGQRIVVNHDGNLRYGVIGSQPIHMINSNKNNNNKSVDICDLWVDIGVCASNETKEVVSIGDPVSFAPNFTILNQEIISAKSLDNRAGVAVLLSLYQRLKKLDISNYKSIYFVASSQEELGLRGAQVAGYNINPDICIAIDAAHATDYPSINNRKYGDIRLSEGAVLPIGSNFDISLQMRLKDNADKRNISYQLDSIPCNSGTDIASIQLIRGGCQSGLISIPCRYMHTPTEIISLKDLESAIDILESFIISK